MFRRLCRLTIALSLSFGAVASTANARGFAQPPGGDPVTVVEAPHQLRRPTPVMSESQRRLVKKILGTAAPRT